MILAHDRRQLARAIERWAFRFPKSTLAAVSATAVVLYGTGRVLTPAASSTLKEATMRARHWDWGS